MTMPLDVVHEITKRAASLRPGPRASVERLIPPTVSFYAEVEAAKQETILNDFGKSEKKKASLKPLKEFLAERRLEKTGYGSGAYRLRIKVEREQSAKKALQREPDPRTQAALERRVDRFLRSCEPYDSLQIKGFFWNLPAELAEEFRAQRLAALDPETAALIKQLEEDARDIEHFENLVEGICEQAVGPDVPAPPKTDTESRIRFA